MFMNTYCFTVINIDILIAIRIPNYISRFIAGLAGDKKRDTN